MRIANKNVLDAFAVKHTDIINALNKWVEIIENNDFNNHNELKNIFPAVDYLGNERYVFNIKGNRYRFVVLVTFIAGIRQVRFCGTHGDYDKIKDIKNI